MAASENYDLIIIGSGPGGYVAAVRAAQLGMKTACVEKAERLGGVCLNVGCIPSKALLDSSEFYHLARHRFAEHGIKTGRVTLDLAAMMGRKDKVVADLTANVKQLLEGHGVAILQGEGRLAGAAQVAVRKGKQKKTYDAQNILLATGSTPVAVPGLDFDGKRIVSS
ncbi:MAG: FAD-dependent oxidoreductase, partial [Desulfobacterales bacterium]